MIAILAAAALLLAACIPEFANPVGTGEPADPAIAGKWNAAPVIDPTDIIVLDIQPVDGGITVVMQPPEGGGKKPLHFKMLDMVTPEARREKRLVFKGRTGIGPGGTKFLSLKPRGEDLGGETGYLVYRYELSGTDIKATGLDNQKLAELVEKGLIAGTSSGSGSDISVKITASPEEAAAFLETPEGQSAFETGPDDVIVLKRTTP